MALREIFAHFGFGYDKAKLAEINRFELANHLLPFLCVKRQPASPPLRDAVWR